MQIIVGGIIEKEGKILMVQEAKKICYGKWVFGCISERVCHFCY